jgi:site-specific recombinase XerD
LIVSGKKKKGSSNEGSKKKPVEAKPKVMSKALIKKLANIEKHKKKKETREQVFTSLAYAHSSTCCLFVSITHDDHICIVMIVLTNWMRNIKSCWYRVVN